MSLFTALANLFKGLARTHAQKKNGHVDWNHAIAPRKGGNFGSM
jgi:hypothetical protein